MQNEQAARPAAPLRQHFLGHPCLILVMGVAGAGKSTLSREIMRRICAVYLDNNHIADAFFPNTRNGARYNRLRSGFYEALYTIAEENLKLGNSVLLDVPHIKEIQSRKWRGRIRRIATRTAAKMIVIRCLCSEEITRARLIARGQQRDHWKLRHWKEFLNEQPLNVRIPFAHLDINTQDDASANVRAAIRYIRNGNKD
jgi:predicted kinase